MPKDKKLISLPEKDYLAIIDINTQLHQSRTVEDINEIANSHILPLLQADHMGVAFVDMDIGNKNVLGQKQFMQSSIPSLKTMGHEFEAIMKAMPYYKSIGKILADTFRPVIAHDIDIPRAEFKNELNHFFNENPQYDNDSYFYLKTVASFLAVMDPPDWNLAVGFNRFYEDAKVWTSRELRIAELIRPNLFQSIKSIAVTLELKKYQTLTDALADTPTAIALVDNFHRVIYRNEAFANLLPVGLGERLNKRISEILENEISTIESVSSPAKELSHPNISFVQLDKGVYRFSYSRVESPAGDQNCHLVRLKPPLEPYAKMSRVMQEKGLTPREMEIACLVRDGMDDQEIAERLFISLHTVKNHVKSIYKKVDVQTRAKLVSFLNPK